MASQNLKVAFVTATIPTVEEIDQFRLIADQCDFSVISAESICGYLGQTSRYQGLRCLALPDYDENPSYLPGLEKVLQGFDVVIVKDRLGLYCYQAVKAKWAHGFHLAVWVDNLTVFPGDDLNEMRVIREETVRAADMFLVQTKAARRTLTLEGVASSRIYNFLPWVEKRLKRTKSSRAKAQQQLGIAEGAFVIAHIGQIEWEEGVIDLASAVAIACERNPGLRRQVRLLFCGVGSYGPQLQNVLNKLGIADKVVCLEPSRDAHDAVLTVADCLYLNNLAGRDRLEGDPYRLLTAMVHDVPVMASRTPLTEEFCGKHRIDFCAGSVESLASAIEKSHDAVALRNNIVRKNSSTVKQRFNDARVRDNMIEMLNTLVGKEVMTAAAPITNQIHEVESQVAAGRYLDAIDIVERLFKSSELPDHQRSHLFRIVGDCFVKLGDQESAKGAYLKSVEFDSYSARSYVGLGTLALLKEAFDVAVIHFQKAVSLAPLDETGNFGLGLAFQGLGEFREANLWVMKALQINPDNSAAVFTANQLAFNLDSFSDAEKALEAYVGRHPRDVNMLFALGGIKFKMGQLNRALSIMDQMLTLDPTNERAQALTAQIRRAMEKGAVSSNG